MSEGARDQISAFQDFRKGNNISNTKQQLLKKFAIVLLQPKEKYNEGLRTVYIHQLKKQKVIFRSLYFLNYL